MNFKTWINEKNVSSYNNWIFPKKKTLLADFKEYKQKEEKKWKKRAEWMGFRYPIFDTFKTFEKDLKKASIITLTDSIINQVHNLSSNNSIEDIEDMVSHYYKPRDVQRIKNGLENNDKIPMGIILKGKNGMHIMTGNTRQSTARVLGIKPKMILVDVST